MQAPHGSSSASYQKEVGSVAPEGRQQGGQRGGGEDGGARRGGEGGGGAAVVPEGLGAVAVDEGGVAADRGGLQRLGAQRRPIQLRRELLGGRGAVVGVGDVGPPHAVVPGNHVGAWGKKAFLVFTLKYCIESLIIHILQRTEHITKLHYKRSIQSCYKDIVSLFDVHMRVRWTSARVLLREETHGAATCGF